MKGVSMNDNIRLLLRRVWQISDTGTDRVWTARSTPYKRHYEDILASSFVKAARAEEFAQLVDLIRGCDSKSFTVPRIIDAIRTQRFSWLPNPVNDEILLHILALTVKLWLFISIDLRNSKQTLKEAICEKITQSFDAPLKDDLSRLSDDFNAKNLERRGGFTIYWTSELTDHLSCVDGKTIKVFRHGSVLQSYLERDDDIERSYYPDDASLNLLSEIDNTFHLLFPYEGAKAAKIARKESQKRQVDLIEAGWADDAVGEFERLQLQTYPRYRNRLAEIQRRYDAAKPIRPKQWWYDRRQRLEWAALMITILVLILTVITVVTSVMQVYAAFTRT